ncbi:MAG TPA: hypothetical protein VFD66_01320 [Verrucomicrobiae bacterium]|nr:hypothetical protein [Verrucomicrobiae bacterium]
MISKERAAHSVHLQWPALLFGLGAFLFFSMQARAQYDPDWSRHFRVGGMVGLNIKAEFTVPSMTSSGSTANPGQPGVHGANHEFDDGYVRVDQNGNPLGQTGYWGYDHPQQWDSASHTLFMHQVTSLNIGASSSSDNAVLPGLDLAYGANLWYWKRLRIGWDLGFGFLPVSISAGANPAANSTQNTYAFDTGTTILPTAPYHGGPSGRGAQISDMASLPATTNLAGAANVTAKLDALLFTMRLGPSLYWDFNRHIGMSVSAGPAMAVLTGDLETSETFTTAHRTAKVSGTDVVYGGYANATVMFHVVQNGDIFLGAEYMPLGKAKIGGGGAEGRLDLGGAVFISAGFNWPF